MSEEKLSPGQIAYRKSLARKAARAAQETGQSVVLRKAAAKKQEPVQETVVTTCQFCGKSLSRPDSVSQGCGDICASKRKLLPVGVTLEQHYEVLQEVVVPEGFILLRDAIQVAREKGCSGYRFIQACGGDRMLHSPFNANFRVVFVLRKRYISEKALADLQLLKKV
jgi:hypothetical protein